MSIKLMILLNSMKMLIVLVMSILLTPDGLGSVPSGLLLSVFGKSDFYLSPLILNLRLFWDPGGKDLLPRSASTKDQDLKSR